MNPAYGQSSEAPYPAQGGSYPVDVEFPLQETYNRFYAVPLLGILVKGIILIPHLIVLYILFACVYLAQYVLWIWVLFGGRYPDWGYSFVGGAIRWYTRVNAFVFGLSDVYPSFSLGDNQNGEARLVFYGPPAGNRFYAIPVVGILVKTIMLIPHLIVLYIVGLVAGVLLYVTWIPVLFTGQYPDWGRDIFGGYLRWSARVFAFLLGLTDSYPPFRLGS